MAWGHGRDAAPTGLAVAPRLAGAAWGPGAGGSASSSAGQAGGSGSRGVAGSGGGEFSAEPSITWHRSAP